MYELSHIANPAARQEELRFRNAKRFDQRLALDALSDPYPPIRHEAAQLLAAHMDAALAERLSAQLMDLSAPIEQRRAAAVALSGATAAQAQRALAAASADADHDLRYQALVSLFDLQADEDTFAPLIPARLEDSDDEVAAVAAQICAARSYGQHIEAIATRRARTRGPMRLQFTLSLAELICHHEPHRQDELVTALIEELMAAMRHEETSAAAAQWLGRLAKHSAQRERITEALIKQLNRWLVHPLFKMEAAVALVELEHPEGIKHLRKQLDSKRRDTQGYAITVAGKYNLMEFYDEIAQLAAGTSYHAETAILALAQYRHPEAIALLSKLRDEHADQECRELARQCMRDVDGSLDYPLE